MVFSHDLSLSFGGGGGLFMIGVNTPPRGTPEVKLGGRIEDKDLPLALCFPDLGVEGKVEIFGRSSFSFDTYVSVRILAGELAADIFLAFGNVSSSESSSTLLFIAIALVATYAMSTLFSSCEATALLFSTVVLSVFIVGVFSTGSSVTAVWFTGICSLPIASELNSNLIYISKIGPRFENRLEVGCFWPRAAEVLQIVEVFASQMHRNFLTDQKLVVHVFGHQQMKCFLYILGSQCFSLVCILGNLSKKHGGLRHNLHILGHFDSHLHCALSHHIQHKLLFLCTNFLCVQISGIGSIFGGWEHKVVFLFSNSQCWFFSGMSCPLIVIAHKLKRTEIRLTAIIPCGLSSFFISSSSMLSSSTHLMTNFLEFNVRWGVTLTGIEPISIVVLKRFLLWCFFSTSIKCCLISLVYIV